MTLILGAVPASADTGVLRATGPVVQVASTGAVIPSAVVVTVLRAYPKQRWMTGYPVALYRHGRRYDDDA